MAKGWKFGFKFPAETFNFVIVLSLLWDSFSLIFKEYLMLLPLA
jgi:hypothetical protein